MMIGNPSLTKHLEIPLNKNKCHYNLLWSQVNHAYAYHCFSQMIAALLAILVLSSSSVRFELKESVILV